PAPGGHVAAARGRAPGTQGPDGLARALRLHRRRADRRGIGMQLIALGAIALLLIVWISGGRQVFQRREWRITSGAFAVAAFVGAAYAGLREAWIAAIALIVLGLWLAVAAR